MAVAAGHQTLPNIMLNRYVPNNSIANAGGRGHAPYDARARASAMGAAVPAGHIFGFVVFLMFCLPSKQLSRILLLGVQTDLTEMGTLLLPFIYFFLYRRTAAPSLASGLSKTVFGLCVASIAMSGLAFAALYGLGTLSPFVTSNLRMMAPFFAAGLIAIQGIRIDRQVFLRWFCFGLLASYVVLLLTYMTGFQRVTTYEGYQNVSSAVVEGRFGNQNGQFGVVGLFLLIDPLKRAFCKTSFDRWLVLIVAMLSLIQLLLLFNRTFLIAVTIELLIIQVYVARIKFSVVVRTAVVVALAISAMVVIYHQFEDVQRQIDRRILVFFEGKAKDAAEDVWVKGGRRKIIESAVDLAKKNWLFGVKPGEPLYVDYSRVGLSQGVYQVDTAILTVWARFGLIPAILFLSYWLSLIADMRSEGADRRRDAYWRNYAKGTAVVIAIYVLASINISSLTTHNAVLFIALFPIFWRDGDHLPRSAMVRQTRFRS